jgi:hypothetical protein
VSLSLYRAPYGAYFVCPPGFEDVTYYRFREPAARREFVIEERDWAQNDAEGWLHNARASLNDLGVSPIMSWPHPQFIVRGFFVSKDMRAVPNLWLMTLAFDNQFRTVAVTGPTSEGDIVLLLTQLSLPTADGAISGWVARGICVAFSPARLPPERFGYVSSGARISVTWEQSDEFGPIDLSYLPVESDDIRQAPPMAYDISTSNEVVVRKLVPQRIGLGDHCFVAEAVFHPPTAIANEVAPVVSAAPRLHVCCSGDCRDDVSLPGVWQDVLASTTPIA